MATGESNSRRVLDKATEAVLGATETVQATSESIAEAIEESRRPGGLLDQAAKWIRQAPLASIAVAFLVGIMFARRR
jgi:hypothetical protein